MIELLSGALVFAYLVSGVHFLQFWRRTRDRLFVHFAVAFWLFALNQLLVSLPGAVDAPNESVYLLRVTGFALILVAILDKNVTRAGP